MLIVLGSFKQWWGEENELFCS